jgi:hypothetical protein
MNVNDDFQELKEMELLCLEDYEKGKFIIVSFDAS